MRRLTSITCLVLLFSGASGYSANLPSSPASEISPMPDLAATAGEFALACKDDQGGCADMVGEVLMKKISFLPTSDICLPGVNYADKVAPWLLAHPETSKMTAENGIYLAITKLYRCGLPNN